MINRTKGGVVFPARIGKGYGWVVTGSILLGLGVLLSMGGSSSGGSGGMLAFGGLLVSTGALCLVIGFWKRMFSAVEQRLIEIQIALLGERAKAATPEDLRAPAKGSEGYLG